jgi:hypothetical protein
MQDDGDFKYRPGASAALTFSPGAWYPKEGESAPFGCRPVGSAKSKTLRFLPWFRLKKTDLAPFRESGSNSFELYKCPVDIEFLCVQRCQHTSIR